MNQTGLDRASIIEKFQNAIDAKIEKGWMEQNFDIEAALNPQTEAPAPSPDSSEKGGGSTNIANNAGALIGICVGGTLVLFCLIASIYYGKNRFKKDDDEFDLENQAVSESAAAKDLASPESSQQGVSDSWSLDDVSEAQTESNTSTDHLLQGQVSSSAQPTLGRIDDEEDWSESDINSSAYDSSTVSSGPARDLTAGSSLAAVGMASTFVAANRASSGAGKYDAMDTSGGSGGTGSGADSSAGGDGTRGVLGAKSADDRGLSTGAAVGIGVATAGALAAGAFAATRSPTSEDGKSPKSLDSTPNSNLDELDSAIEAGNWGAVGALAAILASSGVPPKRESRSAASIRSEDSSGRSSRDASTGPTLDQARAAEIDKLVESGDWQGVVLAAARFEADQTMDGESYSASASRSSYRSGSAQSSATPRSMATSGQSSTNISSARSQAEIRAEVEALVRRVVPEEADNVDEMLTQFKGREEGTILTRKNFMDQFAHISDKPLFDTYFLS